jgi:hypothetical protein
VKKISYRQCAESIKSIAGHLLSDTEIEALVSGIEQRVKNMDAAGITKVEDKLAKAGKELTDEVKKVALLSKRNALMTITIVRDLKKTAKLYPTPYEGLLAYLEDSRRSIEGAGRGVNSVVEGWKSKYLGAFKKELLQNDLQDVFRKDTYEKEIFQEFYEPGSSGNKQAQQIRDIMFALKQDTVKNQNLYGSFIHFLPEHVIKQNYDPNLIKQGFGPDRFKRIFNFDKNLTPEEHNATFKKWAEFIEPLLDKELTFKDSDPQKFLRGAFDGIMSGLHGGKIPQTGAEVNVSYYKAGALAKKASVQRLLHFVDGDAAYAAHKAFSGQRLSGGFLQELEHSATNIGLMQMLGPNPEASIREAVQQLGHDYSRQGMEKETQSLNEHSHKLFTALKFLDRSASIPENASMHTATASVISLLSQAKLGKLLLFALPDKALIHSVLTRNGMGGMDALGHVLKLTKPSNADERLRLVMLGGEVKSFLAQVNSRFTTGAEGGLPSALFNSQKFFFEMTGINWLDDMGTNSIVGALPRHLGSMADREFGSLIPEMQNMFKRYDITPAIWDAWRTTAYSTDASGNIVKGLVGDDNWVTPDRFKDIPDASIDRIIKDRGLKSAPTTRGRMRNELEEKFRTWLISQRDEGVLMPGSKEHRLATFGTQAGTAIGSISRLLMMFKSFPLTVYTKILRREMLGGGARNFSEWLSQESKSKFHTTQLVAMLTMAGYVSLTVDELLTGKKPRKFTDDKGDIDVEHSALLLKDSFLRGGAGSIYADLLMREYNEGYKNIARSVGGPFMNEVMKASSLASADVRGRGKLQDHIDFIKGNTPYVNMFYVKPALDYLIFYNMQEMLDPGSLRKKERETEQNYNQEYWLRPSDVAR